jgi:hypothetical protein
MTSRPPASRSASSRPPGSSSSRPPGPRRLRDTDEARIERRKQAGAHVVLALFRLVKASQLYDASNEAVRTLVAPVTEAIKGYCELFDTDVVRLLFSKDQVFVNRRMMRAPRETFALAVQLGALLMANELNEIALEDDVPAESVATLARLIVDSQRDKNAQNSLHQGGLRGVSLRQAPDADIDVDPDESPIAKVVKSYAASILILGAFHKQLAAGNARGANEVKRIAQKLVALSEVHPELLVATAAGALPDDNPARRDVSTAVIVLAMAKLLTSDRSTLTTITQAALLADCGTAQFGPMRDADDTSVGTLAVLTNIGEFHPASVRRSVVAFESLRLQAYAGAIYADARPHTIMGALLAVARRFNEIRTPKPGEKQVRLDAAVKQLESKATQDTDQACLRLLVSALGFYAPGTMVELDTSELALVSGVPAVALDFSRPPIHIMTDSKKQILASPVEMDLAKQPRGQPKRAIRKVVDLDRVRASGKR